MLICTQIFVSNKLIKVLCCKIFLIVSPHKGTKEVALEEKETALTKEQVRFDSLLQEMDDNATKAANLDEQELARSEKEKVLLSLSEQLRIVDLKLKEDNV